MILTSNSFEKIELEMEEEQTFADVRTRTAKKLGAEIDDIIIISCSDEVTDDTKVGELSDLQLASLVAVRKAKRPAMPNVAELDGEELPCACCSKAKKDAPSAPSRAETMIEFLMDIGFSRVQCEAVLRDNNYNMERSINELLNSRYNRYGYAKFGRFQNLFDGLTQNEKDDVMSLLKYGNPEDVIQIYLSCDKNVDATEYILQN